METAPLRLLDSRRLTGPSLQSLIPTAIAEVGYDCDPAAAEAAWRSQAARMLARLSWRSALSVRHFTGGMAVTLSAPIDVLMAATECNEWAIASASCVLAGAGELALEPRATEVEVMIGAQRSAQLVAMHTDAQTHDVPFLWDDERVSLGMGKRSCSWPLAALPTHIDWPTFGRIPVALISGTNGKTTSSRLLARMVKEAGFVCGNTTTDGVSIDGGEIAEGDWTGPAAARLVLRDPRVEIAVLETARGGILRRGLAIDKADAALITNVSLDHTDDYGVGDLDTMVRVKSVIAHAVRPGGRVVLNADDARLRQLSFAAPITWFSLQPIAADTAAFVRDGTFVWRAQGDETPVCAVAESPMCFSGHAPYNVQNVLGCIAVARALGLPLAAIAAAITRFGAVPADNPGRAEQHTIAGVDVFIDFAHNPEGIDAALTLVTTLRRPSGKLIVITSGAGDRPDVELYASNAAIMRAHPDRVFCRDLHGYLRGRRPGEVAELLAADLRRRGMNDVIIAEDEAACLAQALAGAVSGDMIVLLLHVQRAPVRAVIEGQADVAP